MAKGYKRKWWIKVGIKEVKKHYKNMWNRKVRHSSGLYENCSYKKLNSDSMYDYVP